jgi:hypothetical protein
VVEHYLDTIKRPILAIFSSLYFSFATISKLLISLDNINVLMPSLVIFKNPEFFIRVTSRVQVFKTTARVVPVLPRRKQAADDWLPQSCSAVMGRR